jgi:hypothetical protein
MPRATRNGGELTSWLACARSTNTRCPLKNVWLPTVWSAKDSPVEMYESQTKNEGRGTTTYDRHHGKVDRYLDEIQEIISTNNTVGS